MDKELFVEYFPIPPIILGGMPVGVVMRYFVKHHFGSCLKRTIFSLRRVMTRWIGVTSKPRFGFSGNEGSIGTQFVNDHVQFLSHSAFIEACDSHLMVAALRPGNGRG